MKVFYISPIGKSTPQLFDTFNFESTDNIEEATVVFFDCYSDLGIYDLRLLEMVRSLNIPVVAFQEKDYGGMSKESWDGFNMFPHNKVVMFIRKYDKEVDYPSWCYPYEKIIQNEFEPTTKDELFSRHNDIFFIGNNSPQRENVCNTLRQHFVVDFVLGEERILHDQWVSRARNAKLFLTADGGGFSDERPYQLITVSVMLKQKNNHIQTSPFLDYEDCIEINEHPTGQDITKIRAILDDKSTLHSLYMAGIKKMKAYYTSEYRNNYILSVLNKEGII